MQRSGNVAFPSVPIGNADAPKEVAVTTTDVLLDARPAEPVVLRTARILVVDGEAIARFGLRQLFAGEPELTVVGEAAAPRDALVIADRCPPDLVVLDVSLAAGTPDAGVDLARLLLERHRGVRILVLTGSRDRELMRRTVRLGVHGWMRKNAETADILRAVHALLRGESVFDAGTPVCTEVLRPPAQVAPQPSVRGLGGAALTERENQVLRLLAMGLSNREIGVQLVISEATVKFHVRNLRDKLEVRRRTEIVYTATRQGIV